MAKRIPSEPAKPREPSQPSTDEQSGSAGRRTDVRGSEGKDSGQGRYGQSGLGGKQTETDGQASYRNSGPDGSRQVDTDSNLGSGREDVDSQVKANNAERKRRVPVR